MTARKRWHQPASILETDCVRRCSGRCIGRGAHCGKHPRTGRRRSQAPRQVGPRGGRCSHRVRGNGASRCHRCTRGRREGHRRRGELRYRRPRHNERRQRPSRGGTSAQKKAGIKDSPDLLFQDLTDWSIVQSNGFPDYRYNDREIIRAFADNSAPTYEWLVDHGVVFIDKPPDMPVVTR